MTRSRWVRLVVAAVVVGATVVGVLAVTGDDVREAGDPAAFCERLNRLGELVGAAGTGPEDVEDVPAARDLAADIAAAAEALREVAPEAIASDVRTLSGVTAELARDLRRFYDAIADDPARASDPAFLDSFDLLTEERQEALEEAGAEIRPWVEANCP